ncbi:MAG: hypothetical protein ACI8ZO_001740, partial [Flavobacteriales bacterium]
RIYELTSCAAELINLILMKVIANYIELV